MKISWKIRITVSIVVAASLGVWAVAGERGRPGPGARGKSRFEKDDKNGDGKISKSEFSGPPPLFKKMDTNNDGYISRKENYEFIKKRKGKSRQTPPVSKASKKYPDLELITLDKDKAWKGNAIFTDTPYERVVEVDLNGKVVWQAKVPTGSQKNPGDGRKRCGCAWHISDVEFTDNEKNMVLMLGGKGVYKINRMGEVLWAYENPTVSHDVDVLPNGNFVMSCSGAERDKEFPYTDPQAIEVDKNGKIVWQWHAKNEYADSKYKDIRSRDAGDWTHVNSVTRMKDGSTLLSVRNWNLLVAVDKNGKTVWENGGKGTIHCPHTPVPLKNGNFLVSESMKGRVIEWDPEENRVVWKWPNKHWRRGETYYFFRAAHRLPNGNTFLIDSKGQLIEVSPDGEVVWQVRHPDYFKENRPLKKEELRTSAFFFNAQRRGVKSDGG